MTGQKLYTAINDYTVIDLETCGRSNLDRKKLLKLPLYVSEMIN